MDWSTINFERLKKLRQYTLPPSYRLQDDSGNGCYGDPPGYPTYFTRHVYTQHGNSPSMRSPQMVISHGGVNYVVLDGSDYQRRDYLERLQKRLRGLWKPLPINHIRTQLWIRGTYKHFAHCYADPENMENGRPATVIYPVPYYELKTFQDDPRWSDEYRAAAMAEVEAFNAQVEQRVSRLAVPENHQAYLAIRRFYPDAQPELDLIQNPPEENVPQWWETEAQRPTPETCARTQRWGKRHPFNGTWCQWCGWTDPAQVE